MIGYLIYFNYAKSDDFINSPYNTRQDTFSDRVVRGKIISADGQVLAQTNVYEDGTEERTYPYANMFAHVVGYDTNGKSGLESEANFQLLTSHEFFLNQLKNEFKNQKNTGDTVITTLNADLQTTAYNALGDRRGAVVAIEPSTGKMLVELSKPDFDPNTIADNWDTLVNDESNSSLLNRATNGAYPPGSTFKTAQGLTFLQEGIITEQSPSFPCSRGFHYGRLTVGCHAHGSPLPLIPAIATSCNSYFCWGLFRMFGDRKYGSPQNAITVWKDHMVSQGFGYKLGVDLPGEKRGLIPNAQFYDKAYRGHWNGLTVISISIGQGEILSTPLQIANLGATIANRGHFTTPHIVKEIQDAQLDSIYRHPRNTTIERRHYESVVEGMRAAATGGIAVSRRCLGLDTGAALVIRSTSVSVVSIIGCCLGLWFCGGIISAIVVSVIVALSSHRCVQRYIGHGNGCIVILQFFRFCGNRYAVTVFNRILYLESHFKKCSVCIQFCRGCKYKHCFSFGFIATDRIVDVGQNAIHHGACFR